MTCYCQSYKQYLTMFAIAFALTLLAAGCIAWADTGLASYYTEASCRKEGTSGVYTASGEQYNEQALTCALRRRDFGKRYKVCNTAGKCVVVRHTDYGPGKKPAARGVIIDLTPAAFSILSNGHLEKGVIKVMVEGVK